MTRAELIRALELAEEFVYDPNEDVVFTGKSLRDILTHLRREVENEGWKESDIVAAWERNAKQFRTVIIASAIEHGITVEFEGRTAWVVREDDALAGTTQCRKGPDYIYPG